jgi:hypothetical protein
VAALFSLMKRRRLIMKCRLSRVRFALSLVLACCSAQAFAASVSFIEPTDGATVEKSFSVRFAVDGMEVKPAGELSTTSGHHHLVIDGAPVAVGEVVPFDDHHIHFGKGQTEATVTLPPGVHRLTLQFANGAHQSFGEAMSKTITVHVK